MASIVGKRVARYPAPWRFSTPVASRNTVAGTEPEPAGQVGGNAAGDNVTGASSPSGW